MKKYINNENGAALVIALLTITLIMLFATVMMSNILSSAKQNDIIESKERASHIAEMGATYVKDQVIQFFENNHSENLSGLNAYLSRLGTIFVDEEHRDRYFKLEPFPDGNYYELVNANSNELFLRFSILGQDEKQTKIIKILLEVTLGEENVEDWEQFSTTPPPPPNPNDGNVCYTLDCENIKQSSVHLTENTTIDNRYRNLETGYFYAEKLITTQNNINVLINGNGVFLEGLDINNLTRILVKGHAFLYSQLTSANNPNSEFYSCGNARFTEGINYHGQFGVKMKTISDGLVKFENRTASFGDEAIFYNGLQLSGATVYAGANLHIYIDSDVNTFLTTLGGTIHLTGNLYIYEYGSNEPIVNPEHQKILYNQPAPTFSHLSMSCDGVDVPNIGSSSGVSADFLESEY